MLWCRMDHILDCGCVWETDEEGYADLKTFDPCEDHRKKIRNICDQKLQKLHKDFPNVGTIQIESTISNTIQIYLAELDGMKADPIKKNASGARKSNVIAFKSREHIN